MFDLLLMHFGGFNQSLVVEWNALTWASISISISIVNTFTGTSLASLHSLKKRFHSGTRCQTFAVWGAPTRRYKKKTKPQKKCFFWCENMRRVNCPYTLQLLKSTLRVDRYLYSYLLDNCTYNRQLMQLRTFNLFEENSIKEENALSFSYVLICSTDVSCVYCYTNSVKGKGKTLV